MKGVQLFLWCALSGAVFAADSPTPSHAFVLVAAMGDRFSAVHSVQTIGSHLPAYSRRSLDVEGDGVNKVVLKSLDQAVAKTDPASQRLYLSVHLPRDMQDRESSLEENAFALAVQELRRIPDRSRWYRVVLATPAYRVQDREGLASRQQGMGMYTQSLCSGDLRNCDSRWRAHNDGVAAKTPDGEDTRASRYVAPFLFAKIWILEPNTLDVVETQEVYEHEKIGDPDSDAIDTNRLVPKKTLAARIEHLVEVSARDAVARSELRGKVDVNEKGPVPALK